MRYQPKKVFILENSTYQELTYQDYCQKRQNDDSYAERYFIPLQGMLLEVSQDIYSEFYRDKERERYLRKLDRENKLLSLESLKRDGNGTADISLSLSDDIAEKVISDLLLDRLRESISLLTAEEQQLIRQHYYDEISEVELSRKYGISQQAVSKRLKKVREKLKNLLEQ